MLLVIEPNSDLPIYLQLRNQIVQALVRGELFEGDSLPSVRQLAVQLGINLHTVNKAYRVLAEEGYLRIFGRKGVRVAKLPQCTQDYLQQLTAALKHLYIEAQSHGVDAQRFQQCLDQATAAVTAKAPGNPAFSAKNSAPAGTTAPDTPDAPAAIDTPAAPSKPHKEVQ